MSGSRPPSYITTVADLRGILVTIYAGIIKLWAQAISVFPRKRERREVSAILEDFEKALVSINKEISRVNDGVLAANGRRFAESQANLLNADTSHSNAPRAQKFDTTADPKFPLDNVPYPRNTYFSGRGAFLERLKAELVPTNDPQEIRCCLLSGPAGIGKTQIALQYAMGRKDLAFAKDPKAEVVILWIKCEDGLQLAQSLREIVTLVGLVDADENTDVEKCRLLLFRWLKTTEHKWLIVFDNAEKEDLLRGVWPYGLRGSVLVTSKHPMLASDLTGEAIEVSKFSDEEGSAFLQKLLARKEYSGAELESAALLSQELGGLPLALQLMGKRVKSQGGKIGQFLNMYRRDPRRLHKDASKGAKDIFYDKTLANAWSESFSPLAEDLDSLTLMSILCCLGPEHIPKALFDHEDVAALGDFSSELEFCSDPFRFGKALEPIVDYSMITVDVDEDFMSMHRMIQSSFCDWLEKDHGLRTPILHTAKLLSKGFPEHHLGVSLRTDYNTCRRLAPHVLALCVCYRQHKFDATEEQIFVDFTSLLGSFAWYLMENNFWTECREVIQVGEAICQDHNSLAYGHLCNTAAIIEYERGHGAAAWPYMKKALAIREDKWDSDDPGHCDTYTNHALLLMTENASPEKFQEAESLLRKVIELAKPHHDKLHSVLHHHYTNLGVCLTHQGKYDDALEWVNKGMDHAFNEHFEAASLYDLGNIHYNQENYDEAIDCFTKAEATFTANNPLAAHATACQLKLGCIEIRQKKYHEAIERLGRTLDLCRVAEKNKGDAGDTARVMRRLAEALELAGDKTGKYKRLEAEAVRRKLQGSRAEELGDTERSYNMLVFVAFW
ncbi:unnamed protein product [Alternaria alternata]